jgi:signal transduction histidine kinase
LAISIVFDIFGQIIMTYSAQHFDTAHNMAHILKDSGYFINIIGLALSSIQYNLRLRETNDRLRESNEMLTIQYQKVKESEKMQKEFINIAAHELRTPTQAISGNLELIKMTCIPSIFETASIGHVDIRRELERLAKDEDRLHDFAYGLVSTYRNAQRLEKLVNDILDTSRIEGNRLELHKESFDMNEEIQNVIKDIHNRNSLSSHHGNSSAPIDIVFEPPEYPIIVSADKVRIFEALSNLINNAIKFSNGKPITVSARKLKKNKEHFPGIDKEKEEVQDMEDAEIAIVSIIDRGKGIDREILPRLFTKFATKSNQGTGLGLYIAKNIIEAHDGKIWAQDNADGKGATFSFSLPLDQ